MWNNGAALAGVHPDAAVVFLNSTKKNLQNCSSNIGVSCCVQIQLEGTSAGNLFLIEKEKNAGRPFPFQNTFSFFRQACCNATPTLSSAVYEFSNTRRPTSFLESYPAASSQTNNNALIPRPSPLTSILLIFANRACYGHYAKGRA